MLVKRTFQQHCNSTTLRYAFTGCLSVCLSVKIITKEKEEKKRLREAGLVIPKE